MKLKNAAVLLTLLLIVCSSIRSYSIVFVHIGRQLPDYLPDALFQARLFNQECEIYLLANQEALEKHAQDEAIRITTIPLETLRKTKTHKEFIQNSRLDRQDRDGFWFYASERFLYLDDFMLQYNLHHVIHLESDNMLYVDLSELLPVFTKKYPSIGAVFDNDERCVPSFVYIANRNVMHQLAKHFAKYAGYGKNDMRVLAHFKYDQEKGAVLNLPIIMDAYQKKHPLRSPVGHVPSNPLEYSRCFKHFKSIFDAAALGQYLGGIDPRNGHSQPGFINESCLFNPSHFAYEWVVDSEGRKVPFALFEDELYRINNLHIHSKDLKKFLSLDRAIKKIVEAEDVDL